jgi:hypothetical protein
MFQLAPSLFATSMISPAIISFPSVSLPPASRPRAKRSSIYQAVCEGGRRGGTPLGAQIGFQSTPPARPMPTHVALEVGEKDGNTKGRQMGAIHRAIQRRGDAAPGERPAMLSPLPPQRGSRVPAGFPCSDGCRGAMHGAPGMGLAGARQRCGIDAIGMGNVQAAPDLDPMHDGIAAERADELAVGIHHRQDVALHAHHQW